MPVNPYFNHRTFVSEQDLVQDLMDEAIAMYGHSVYYIPRTTNTLDAFLGENPLASFEEAFELEMYIKTFDNFAGQSEFIGKFGLHIEDQMTLSVSERRFRNAVIGRTRLGLVRPRENDLIYIEMTPTNRYLFNIRFVENKEMLFQLGKLYTYELKCEMFNYSNEQVATNVDEINDVAAAVAYTINVDVESGGDGDFRKGETVYQGTSVDDATATGVVWTWTRSTRVLQLQHITGTFAGNTDVIGDTSGAVWTTVTDAPETAPTVNDPITDNEFLKGNPLDIVKTRGERTRT